MRCSGDGSPPWHVLQEHARPARRAWIPFEEPRVRASSGHGKTRASPCYAQTRGRRGDASLTRGPPHGADSPSPLIGLRRVCAVPPGRIASKQLPQTTPRRRIGWFSSRSLYSDSTSNATVSRNQPSPHSNQDRYIIKHRLPELVSWLRNQLAPAAPTKVHWK